MSEERYKERIHFVLGSTGAGKTTYAIQLAHKLGGIRFAVDEWMRELYHQDMGDTINYDWIMERIGRCENKIWQEVEALLKINVPVVLELSMSTVELRKKQLDIARGFQKALLIHYLKVDSKIRWKRVDQRNKEKGASYAFHVNLEMFDFVEGMFEEPTYSEIPDLKIIEN